MRKEHEIVVVYIENIDAQQFQQLRQLVQSNKDTHFVLYKSANTQRGFQRAQVHSGAEGAQFATLSDFEEMQ